MPELHTYTVVVEDSNDGEYFSEWSQTVEAENVDHAIEQAEDWGDGIVAVAVYQLLWTEEGGYE